MKPFIQAAEVWLPSQNSTTLDFGAGLFGDAKGFEVTSQAMSFTRGEGLPGAAWEQGRPLLLKQFDPAKFRRTSAANEAGLTCAVALPFFAGGQLTAVLVLFGRDDGHCTGALELWRNDPRISSDMTLVDGYFGGVPPAFEAVARDTYLPRGAGLPGLAWQREEFVVMSELSESTRFLRGDLASDAGIRRGLAFPCCTRGHANYVLAMLSGGKTPVVRRAERWVVDLAGECLRRVGGYCEEQGSLDEQPLAIELSAWCEGATTTLLAGKPVVLDKLTAADGAMGAAAVACGASGVVCIPILVDDKTSEMAVLYL
jgi:hypothetical protein